MTSREVVQQAYDAVQVRIYTTFLNVRLTESCQIEESSAAENARNGLSRLLQAKVEALEFDSAKTRRKPKNK